MSFLRIGVQCAVIDDDQRVLLSKRSDLDVWNLPGGRAEVGEELAKTAAREVLEETGIVAYVQQPIGLYYWADFQRLNVLYVGWPLGGRLLQTTTETKANNFFSQSKLPVMPWAAPVEDAFAVNRPPPRVIKQHPAEVRIIKNKLRRRWLFNLLSRKPEPRFPRLNVTAAALIWNTAHDALLMVRDKKAPVGLPRVLCKGHQPPWVEVLQCYRLGALDLYWVGLWQNLEQNALEFVFAATVDPAWGTGAAGEWLPVSDAVGLEHALLSGRDAQYVVQVEPDYRQAVVWTIYA